MSAEKQSYSLIFYGDDFTGSTDALEFMSMHGVNTMLFMDVPDDETLKKFPHINAFGVAGMTRSLQHDEMNEVLQKDFSAIAAFNTKHIHYKICSTFDSSPLIGSIGLAIDVAANIFKVSRVPVLGGMPLIGRYCAFSNLFVRMGIGSNGKIYRLDRHPSMSKHPVTPADESDLRLHLSKQTSKNIAAVQLDTMELGVQLWNDTLSQDDEVVVVDAMNSIDLEKFGAWIDAHQNTEKIFSVGSSGVEAGLGMHWNSIGKFNADVQWDKPGDSGPMLILSGSQSPVTSSQIEYAKTKGYHLISFDPTLSFTFSEIEKIASEASSHIAKGKHVVLYSGERSTEQIDSTLLGNALGKMALGILQVCTVKRIIVCGGDTSSFTARAMGITAVEMIAPIVHGAPLCKVYSTYKEVDGKEMNFKGGQVGPENYFDLIEQGYKI